MLAAQGPTLALGAEQQQSKTVAYAAAGTDPLSGIAYYGDRSKCRMSAETANAYAKQLEAMQPSMTEDGKNFGFPARS